MSLTPMNDRSALSPLRGFQFDQAQRRRELRVLNHGLDRAETVAMDLIDSQAVSAVSRVAFDEEWNFLRYGLSLVGMSAAGQELLARRANQLSNLNTNRISRKFGS